MENNDMMNSIPDYCIDMALATDFTDSGSLTYDGTSTDSSPSPIMMFSNPDSLNYDAFPGALDPFSTLEQQSAGPVVEFTDLTVPYHEDRRRRRSHVIRDKQTISTMHMRRRAQNRASQRAFRERKEKHAQDLQQQLDELETKHRDLLKSYNKLDDTNARMAQELEKLREQMSMLQASGSKTLDDLVASALFEPFDFDQQPETTLNSNG